MTCKNCQSYLKSFEVSLVTTLNFGHKIVVKKNLASLKRERLGQGLQDKFAYLK